MSCLFCFELEKKEDMFLFPLERKACGKEENVQLHGPSATAFYSFWFEGGGAHFSDICCISSFIGTSDETQLLVGHAFEISIWSWEDLDLWKSAGGRLLVCHLLWGKCIHCPGWTSLCRTYGIYCLKDSIKKEINDFSNFSLFIIFEFILGCKAQIRIGPHVCARNHPRFAHFVWF